MPLVAYVQVPGRIQTNTRGIIQAGVGGGATVPGKVGGAIARDRGDDAIGVHFSDALITPVRDIQIARAVQNHASGII